MKWRLNLFGGFQLVSPNGKPFRTRSNNLKVLLAYVGLQNGDGALRKPLAHALFSPDELPGLPNMALLLTRSLFALRELSDQPVLLSSPDKLALCSENVTVDALDFEKLIQAARKEPDSVRAGCLWLQAVQLASGEPLPDLDHPVLQPLKARLLNGAVEAISMLAAGPLGGQSLSLILERIESLRIESQLNSARVEALMRTYASLGLKEDLVRTFSVFETQLDYEFGEGPSHALASLFNRLLNELDAPTQAVVQRNCPIRPDSIIGRDELVAQLVTTIQDSEASNFITLTGQSGIGKTHVLRHLFWHLEAQVPIEMVDLEQMPVEVARQYLASRPTSVIFIDHVGTLDPETERLLTELAGVKIVIASHSRLGYRNELVVVVGPLDESSSSELIRANQGLVSGIDSSEASSADEIIRLTQLCDGIPLALEIAGRLSGSIGVRATITALERDLGNLAYGRTTPNRKNSLHLAIQSSFEHLSDHSRLLVSLLAHLGVSCHIDHLLFGTEAMPSDLEEGILAGLIVREVARPYVRVSGSTASFVISIPERTLPSDFFVRSVSWFLEQSQRSPVDLSVADSLPLAIRIINELVGQGHAIEAMDLLASLRPWLGSNSLAPKDLALMESTLARHQDVPAWAPCVLAIAASYFHAGAFQDMLNHLEKALASDGSKTLLPDHRCQMQMQYALAKRCKNDIPGAIRGYEEAIGLADESVADSTLVRCYYNLGTLFESQDRLPEALIAQESAADHFCEDTDPRVESLVNTCIGRLRYRVDNDLAAASLILEATLAHATQRADRRSTAEILQNLGLIYYERGLAAKAALAETIGSLMLLDFGYTPEYRRLTRSSLVTLACGLLGFGEGTLGRAVRGVVDRLGNAELYLPNQAMFEHLQDLTYRNPENLKLSLISEADLRDLLVQCHQTLSAALSDEVSCSELVRIGALAVGTSASTGDSRRRRSGAMA